MGLLDIPDRLPYPCPKCGEHRVVYDGLLVWRSGDRPPRNLARKQVGFSPRADYERERIYHCRNCGAEFYQDVEQRRFHLYEEGKQGVFRYITAHETWILSYYDPDQRRTRNRIWNKADQSWQEEETT